MNSNEEALKQLGIEIPEGYEFVKYNYPQKDDHFINRDNEIQLSGGSYERNFFIIKEKIETDCWYLVEDIIGDRPVIYLTKNKEWIFYRGRENDTLHFNEYKIISKMEVVK